MSPSKELALKNLEEQLQAKIREIIFLKGQSKAFGMDEVWNDLDRAGNLIAAAKQRVEEYLDAAYHRSEIETR